MGKFLHRIVPLVTVYLRKNALMHILHKKPLHNSDGASDFNSTKLIYIHHNIKRENYQAYCHYRRNFIKGKLQENLAKTKKIAFIL